jgi:hypothetical protein
MPCGVVQRLERHDHLRGRAVRVGDDVLRRVALDRVGVHLRHDQRHVGVHPVERAVVDDDAALRGGLGRVGLGRTGAGGEQGDVPAGEVEVLDVLDLEHLAGFAELDLGALRTRRCHRSDLVAGKLALGEDVQHFAPDVARRADDDYPITHLPDH